MPHPAHNCNAQTTTLACPPFHAEERRPKLLLPRGARDGYARALEEPAQSSEALPHQDGPVDDDYDPEDQAFAQQSPRRKGER